MLKYKVKLRFYVFFLFLFIFLSYYLFIFFSVLYTKKRNETYILCQIWHHWDYEKVLQKILLLSLIIYMLWPAKDV